MGCCCSKEKNDQDNEQADERTRLLDQKSRFIDPSQGTTSSSQLNHHNQNSVLNSGLQTNDSSGYPNQSVNDNNYDNHFMINQQNGNLNQLGSNGQQQNLSESNQLFEKILSEVIHVTPAFDQRSSQGVNNNAYQGNDLMQFTSTGMNLNTSQVHPVQEMPFKMKGLLEAQALNKQQQLSLPDGVPAPFSVLAAQPPFSNDIRLINNVAHEAYNCISNFSLHVPDNVAFDFKPVVL